MDMRRHKYTVHARRETEPASTDNTPPDLGDPELHNVYKQCWSAIRNYREYHGDILQIHNRLLTSINTLDVEQDLWAIFDQQTKAFKINFSYGFVLRHVETGELRYYHARGNDFHLLDFPQLVRNEVDFVHILEVISREDVLEYIREQRPDRNWIVDMVTNLSVYIYVMSYELD
jgi:hypothetical protein